MKKEKHDVRRTHAKEFINKSYVANEKEGLKNYVQYIKEIESR